MCFSLYGCALLRLYGFSAFFYAFSDMEAKPVHLAAALSAFANASSQLLP